MPRTPVPCGLAVFLAALTVLVVLARPSPTHADEVSSSLTPERASAFARLAIKGMGKEFPNKPEHVLAGPGDVKSPKDLHPAFYGCYDWHSSVHGHWMLARLLHRFPNLPEANEIRSQLAAHLTAENLKAEADYFARKESKPFERPYGWAWLLKLAEELKGWDDPDAKTWDSNLQPLAEVVVTRFLEFFPKQTYPIRTGVHPNTAFGLSFAHDYARAVGDAKLKGLVEERARAYFAADADAPARWEPSGADFFSPSLMEADLMRRVLPAAEFRDWFRKFLPGADESKPEALFTPATVTDRTDPQLVHLDGLNLSRAWTMQSIAAALPAGDPARTALAAASARHAQAALGHVASGDYAGEHWLATFAVYLLTGPSPSPPPTRIAWTSSRVAGTPEPPPPYTIEPAFPKLKFDRPLLIASAKGSDRLFVGEQGGKVFSFPVDSAVAKADLAIDLAARGGKFTHLYGLTFHPKFRQYRQAFLCYVTEDGKPDGTRLSRFTVSRTDPPTIDPASEQVLLTWLSGGHNGGCLAFGPDGYLYVSTGDAEVPSPPDPRDTGQDISDLLGSILRIDVDRQDASRPYRVPPDNPFVKLPGARPEVWAYGLRNPWKMSFDRLKGDLWLGDVGWELWELVYKVERGGNYGWSIVEGPQPVHPAGKLGPTPILPPTVVHPHSEAASVTGGFVYRGERLADLNGVYVYGDYQSGKIWGLRHDGKKVTWQKLLADTPLELVSFGEDNRGELYLLDYERTRQLHRLVPNPAAARANEDFPRILSRTGLFASTRDHTPAPGVIAYEINAPLWSDRARAERLMALPGTSRVEFGEQGGWRLPEGAVLARTVSMELDNGNAATRRRLETQVLHLEAGSWRPYTYVWNDEQSDATLADAAGASLSLSVVDRSAPGGRRNQTYRVHARAECVLCHNPWVEKKTTIFGRQSASPLGVSTGQLNRDVRAGSVSVNQLHALERMGLFAKPLAASPDDLAKTADPYDASSDVDRRARAYLQVNCAHCHQFNAGGSATIWLSDDVALDKMNAVDALPSQGTFGISDARIIRPGDPDGSVLLYRTAKLGGGRMPRVGSERVDDRGVAMLGEWISRMKRPEGEGPAKGEGISALEVLGSGTTPDARAAAIRTLLATTRGAMTLMRAIDRGAVTAQARRESVAQAAAHPSVEVRDLFERYIPEAERVARLGEAINPKTILDLTGDVRRGRDVFMNNAGARCKSCHRLEGAGEVLGPDLAKIGAKYPRAELLRQILEPSQTIDPKFATYALETKSGQVVTGVLLEKTEKQVVLKNAEARETRILADQVEQMVPLARSMMPELLLRDLTAQQAADLLEFLGSLK